MIQREFKVLQKLGMHARPAAMLVNEAGKFKSSVLVSKYGLEINGKSLMGLMLLAAESGSTLLVKVNGPDEAAAMDALAELFKKKFDEE
ncbi:MAG: HPr family phosphocarrier protein [Elusimicrobia bacterium]|nr:HPr family phosphocarrier protein [Elusimicrobiota bacterium]